MLNSLAHSLQPCVLQARWDAQVCKLKFLTRLYFRLTQGALKKIIHAWVSPWTNQMRTLKVGTWREVFLKPPGDINKELGWEDLQRFTHSGGAGLG